jgi:ATP-dependent Clp protease ATP-binding subunit ClpC
LDRGALCDYAARPSGAERSSTKELSVGAVAAWQLAVWEAAWLKYQYVEKEHVLCGIFSLEKLLDPEKPRFDAETREALQREHEDVVGVLRGFRIDPVKFRRRVRAAVGKGSFEHTDKVIHRSAWCKLVFAGAQEIADTYRTEVNCLVLLASIMRDPGKTILTALSEIGVNARELLERAGLVGLHIEPGEAKDVPKQDASGTPNLDRFGRDLTRLAREGKLGPFVGRRKELLQVIQTLARKAKNNPVLVGEAGVGKTAIVEALAMRIAQGKNTDVLGDKRIVELSTGALVAGTMYRGEFEERLMRVIGEARSHREVIVFIDELHTLIGAGKASGGSLDAANIMKPALANGELRCIGATTIAEYRRYVESDPALERRFEKIVVSEPGRDEALEILGGIRAKLEEHHRVRITDQALVAAVDLAIRFDTDHQLPDKAIDLVDKAAARTRIPLLSMMQPERDRNSPPRHQDTKENLRAKPEDRKSVKSVDKSFGEEVGDEAVAEVLAEKMDLPLEIVRGHQAGMGGARLLELETRLKERIVGQDEAVGRVCRRLKMAHAGVLERRGPLAVFLFLGPTGVGKTETARALAEFLFGSESEMIRLDMSEYMEEHSVAKLIGSPPGYVGHDEEGQLTGKLRTKPYSVVLLDEIEKAHPRVFDLFLQVFDDGRLTDARGRVADARNAIFIMTSNIQVGRERSARVGFGERPSEEAKPGLPGELMRYFRPEFINRIDEQIVFRALDENDIRRILRPMLDRIRARLQQQHGVLLEASADAEELIARTGYSSAFGARELRRTVEQLLEAPLSQLVLEGRLAQHKRWQVSVENGQVRIVPATE